MAFCLMGQVHPHKRVYSAVPEWMKALLKAKEFEEVVGNVVEIGNLKVGIEICLDHAMGVLAAQKHHRVDLQLIASAGMSIARGPVVTPRGGPVFLADGFGRTELNQNLFGHGAEAARTPEGRLYDVGPVRYSSLFTSLAHWSNHVLESLTGTDVAAAAGEGWEGLDITRVNALGPDWARKIEGMYISQHYKDLQRSHAAVLRTLNAEQMRDAPAEPALYSTVDCYKPVPL